MYRSLSWHSEAHQRLGLHRLALVDLGCSPAKARRREGAAAAHIAGEEGLQEGHTLVAAGEMVEGRQVHQIAVEEDLQEDHTPVAAGGMVEGRQVHQIAVEERREEDRSRLAGTVVEGPRRIRADSRLEGVRMTLWMRTQEECRCVWRKEAVVGREYLVLVNGGAEATF